jgi:MFS family permease
LTPIIGMELPEKTESLSGTEGSTGFASRRGAAAIFAVLFLVYVSDYADRFVVASMISFIKEDKAWKITDAQAGWLMGVVILFITVFSIPASMLIDRWSRRKMIAIMTFFWSLATLACSFTASYWQLLVARSFIGIGESGYAPGGTALLSAAFPEEKRARIMGFWNISIPLGMGIGLAAGGQIAKHWGWHHAFGLVAAPGMMLAIAAWFLPDYRTVKPAGGAGLASDFFRDLIAVFSIPSAFFTYLGFAMNVSITTALATWLSVYFERTGLAQKGAGGGLATMVFALVLVGAPLGGWLSDQWWRRRPEGRLQLPAVTSIAAAVVLYIAFLFPGQKLTQMPLLIAFGILVTCFIAPAAAVTQDVVHPGLRAFSYAMCVIVQHLAGDVWSPGIVGWLSDRIGLAEAVRFVPAWGSLAAGFFLLAARFYRRDLARVERVELRAEERPG